MTSEQCRTAAKRAGYGRRWLGSSRDDNEAAGCVLWEDGNVEFNTATNQRAAACNVRGTCLCTRPAGGTADELQVVGGLVP